MFIYHENVVRDRESTAVCRNHVRAAMRHHRNLCLLRVLLKTHRSDFTASQEIRREITEAERLMARQEGLCQGNEFRDLREMMVTETAEFRPLM